MDTLWTFEGSQGCGKSQALRVLGEHFHAEITAPIGSTDFVRELRGIWIAELSELDSLRGHEASTVKRLLSATQDRFVEKYQTHASTYQRRAVAVATTNESQYWQDATGARRLIPVRVGAIRIDAIREFRQQWLAEARQQYDEAAKWWEFPVSMAEAQEERQHVDPWEDKLQELMLYGQRVPDPGLNPGDSGMVVRPWPAEWISSVEIMRDWLQLESHHTPQTSGNRLAKVMRRLHWKPKKRRDCRGWAPIPDVDPAPETLMSPQVSSPASFEHGHPDSADT